MEERHIENFEHTAERDPQLEQLGALAIELDFDEPAELRALRGTVLASLQDGGKDAGIEAMTAYQKAAAAWVETRAPKSDAHIGYRVAVGALWLEGGAVAEGLDELWETAYQAGQTPGIQPLREILEDFVVNYDATSG